MFFHYFRKRKIMALADKIATDQQAVAAAQAALDAANSELAKDQAALAALQPQLSAWASVESFASTLGGDQQAQLLHLVTLGKATIDP